MKKLKCYYAHTMLSYGSTIEEHDIQLLHGLGLEVINPNCKEISDGMSKYIEKYGRSNVMRYFQDIVESCDIVAFRALPDGTILSGISAELLAAKAAFIPIIELPCSLEKRMTEYPETKQLLLEMGFYKINNG